MPKHSIFSSLLILLLSACTYSTPEIEGFDPYIWQRDKWGCKGQRAAMVPAVLKAKDKIHGLREAEIMHMFGKADEQELYQRSQKFLIYYLDPNKKCSNPEEVKAAPDALHIRLNALGLANELYVRNR